METQPKTMRAVRLIALRETICEEIPIPVPNDGQVLVKMDAAPINPSDLVFMVGKYGFMRDFPTTPGFEGTGTVVENGGGLRGWMLKGNRVSVSVQRDEGTWAEYCVVNTDKCIKLDKDVTVEQGACAIANPITCIALLELVEKGEHKAIISTAACSSLGRMIERHFAVAGIDVINVVRREGQVDMLKAANVKYILNSSDEDFEEKLKEMCKTVKPTCLLDAVAGELCGTILNAMPKKSVAHIYGMLSMKPVSGISGGALIFEQKEVHGFHLKFWLKEKSKLGMMWMADNLSEYLRTTLQTKIAK